jgi:hypothetical protein
MKTTNKPQTPGAWDVFNFLRKPAHDFGWDWGPAFAPAGLPGHAGILAFDRALITGARPSTSADAALRS